jgi:hypothetical protein
MTTSAYEIPRRLEWTDTARAIVLLPLAVVLLAFLAIREYG